MSCPDWHTLCDRRRSAPGDGPGWQAAMFHLDGCEDCQETALAADPTLLFRRLPVLEAGAGEVEAMKRAVAGMRRGEAIEPHRAPLRRVSIRHLVRAAALAVVLLGSLLLSGAQPPSPAVGEPAEAVAVAAELASDFEWPPLVETIDPSYGSIIQLVDDEIALLVVLPSDPVSVAATDAEVVYPDA